MITISALKDAIAGHAAIRRIRRLQPAGGAGDIVFHGWELVHAESVSAPMRAESHGVS